MNARTLFLAFWPMAAMGQGFAGLGEDASGFQVPVQGNQLIFPADDGPHPAYKIEWWYVTANLTDAAGVDYGLQWTLFRTAFALGDADGWTSAQAWMGHAAVTTPDAHFVTERIARGGIGQAGVVANPLRAWIDDWTLTDTRMQASAPDFAFDMALANTGPVVLHGDGGYSVKSPDGQASYYYSRPFLDIAGTLTLPDGVVAVSGQAWLDREWSSQPLSATQLGWDWFSLSFDSGDKMMGFIVRQADGGQFTSATWIGVDGTTIPYGDGALTATPLAQHETNGATVPVVWRVDLPDKGVDVTVTAINPDAWMPTTVPYWEGPVTVSGTHSGRGYLEMTGYDAD